MKNPFGRKTLAALAFVGMLCAVPALADDSPHDVVRGALGEAERSASVEASLNKLSSETYAPEVKASARSQAGGIIHAARAFRPVEIDQVPQDWAEAGLDISKAKREGDRLVQVLPSGARVTFTVDPETQAFVERMLDNYNVPHSGIVLLDPKTGRVRAFVSHTEAKPAVDGLARKSMAPSASVFKIVTAAALMESAGIRPNQKTCYHGGRSRLTARNIKGDRRRDHKCADLGAALAWSINSIMAKLTYKHLDKDDLEVWAERFGYNTEIPFELPVEVSTAEFVEDPLERARAAAGFWHTHLSPLHGAMIGAAVANEGVMMTPSIVEKYENADGEVLHHFKPRVFRRVMSPNTAKRLGRMMVKTTEKGTARRYFQRRRSFPNHIIASGKTGTLSNKNPYLGFTWFVGFAENEKLDGERVAVSGLVCNTPKWRIKGPYAASEAVRKHFERREAEVKRENSVAAR